MAHPLRDVDEAWIQDYCARHGLRSPLAPAALSVTIPSPAVRAGHLPPPVPDERPRYRSKTEARYAAYLTACQQAGTIEVWRYEPWAFKLATRTTYTPDFLVQYVESTILTFYEVKGAYIRDRALDKPKMTARLWPQFRFRLAVWDHGQWHERDLPA
jgi:hypothetical protein